MVVAGAWSFAVAFAGGSLGLVLGSVRLPAILAAGSTPAAATGANIGISAIAALSASIVHVRAGNVNWRLFAWMAPPSALGAVVGGFAAGLVPQALLLMVIGAALVYFGIAQLRSKAGARPQKSGAPPVGVLVGGGAAIGLMGGFIGIVLGALRMPLLLRYAGDTPARVVGTNLTVGVVVGIAGVVGHVPSGMDWTVLAVAGSASIPGAVLGSRLTGRLEPERLLRAIGWILVVAGLAAVGQGIVEAA